MGVNGGQGQGDGDDGTRDDGTRDGADEDEAGLRCTTHFSGRLTM